MSTAALRELRSDFDTAWNNRETVRALYGFQKYREHLNHGLSHEERVVAVGPAPNRPVVDLHDAHRHRRCHAQIDKVCTDVLELLARRMWMGGCVDGDIDDRLSALDQLVERHRSAGYVAEGEIRDERHSA